MELAVTTCRHLGLMQARVQRAVRQRIEDDRGEGVISMAIAILIVAFLGVAMWTAFKGFAGNAAKEAESQIKKVGS